jgi:hypothetical protein
MQFESAVQLLCDAGVDFVVIGGVAATFHGSVRVTYDLGICYSRVSSNVRSLAAALAPFHPRPRGFAEDLPFIWDEATVRNSTILTLRTDLGEIDLLAEVAGLGSYSEVKAHSLIVSAFGRQLRALDLQSLILAKRTAGREKDLSALPELESLLEAGET